MPKSVNVDWELAKSLHQQGLSCVKIAERLGCNAATVRTRACREKWREIATKSLEILKQEPETLEQRADRWRYRMVAVCEKKLSYLEQLDPADFGPKDLLMLTQVERIANENARVTMKMDLQDEREQGKDNTLVKIFVTPLQAQKYGGDLPANCVVISELPPMPEVRANMTMEEPIDPDERRAWGLPELPPQLPPAEGAA